MEAFREALLHSDGVETDVICSADGQPYLIHDSSIKYIPHIKSWASYDLRRNLDDRSARRVGKWNFNRLYSWQIDELRLKGGERIPKLSELFELASSLPRVHEKIFNLELKAPRTAGAVIKAIDQAEAQGQIDRAQVIVTSFDHDEVGVAQKLDPALHTGLIFWHDDIWGCRLYPWEKGNQAEAKPMVLHSLEDPDIRKIMPDHFVVPAQGLSWVYARAVRNDLYPESSFIVWTAGKEPMPEKNKALRRVLNDPETASCISAVITNHPREMKRFLSGFSPQV